MSPLSGHAMVPCDLNGLARRLGHVDALAVRLALDKGTAVDVARARVRSIDESDASAAGERHVASDDIEAAVVARTIGAYVGTHVGPLSVVADKEVARARARRAVPRAHALTPDGVRFP